MSDFSEKDQGFFESSKRNKKNSKNLLTNRNACGIILNVLRGTQTSARIQNGLVVQLVRTLACHARGRGFEPHPGRQLYSTAHAGMAQSVEHILGKDEVTSSILVSSSKKS